MDERLQRLIDEAEIMRQLVAYCRSMDRCDRALGHGVFFADATADYGPIFQGLGTAFVDHCCTAHLAMENHQHRIFNVTIRLAGDTAGSETYVDARFRTSRNGEVLERATRGRYLDRWERRDGRWAIAHRRYLHETDEVRPTTGGRFPPEGCRDAGDESYALVG